MVSVLFFDLQSSMMFFFLIKNLITVSYQYNCKFYINRFNSIFAGSLILMYFFSIIKIFSFIYFIIYLLANMTQ